MGDEPTETRAESDTPKPTETIATASDGDTTATAEQTPTDEAGGDDTDAGVGLSTSPASPFAPFCSGADPLVYLVYFV